MVTYSNRIMKEKINDYCKIYQESLVYCHVVQNLQIGYKFRVHVVHENILEHLHISIQLWQTIWNAESTFMQCKLH